MAGVLPRGLRDQPRRRLARLLEPSTPASVGLQFQLPGSAEVIYAEGEVVREWVEAEQAATHGVRFTLLTERHRQLIRRWVEDATTEE